MVKGTTCRGLPKTPTILLIFSATFSMWYFQLTWSSSKTPRYFTWSLHSREVRIRLLLSNIRKWTEWSILQWFNSTCGHRKQEQQPGFNTKDWTEFLSSKMTSVEREISTFLKSLILVYFLAILCKWCSIFIGNHCLHCLYSFCIKICITLEYFCMIDLTWRFQRTGLNWPFVCIVFI